MLLYLWPVSSRHLFRTMSWFYVYKNFLKLIKIWVIGSVESSQLEQQQQKKISEFAIIFGSIVWYLRFLLVTWSLLSSDPSHAFSSACLFVLFPGSQDFFLSVACCFGVERLGEQAGDECNAVLLLFPKGAQRTGAHCKMNCHLKPKTIMYSQNPKPIALISNNY